MDILELLKCEIAQRKKMDLEEVEINKPFMEYGLDSKEIVSISGKLEKQLGTELSPTLLLDYPTIAQLHSFLTERQSKEEEICVKTEEVINEVSPVSIIGMSCKFPKAEGLSEFQKVLENQKDCVEKVSVKRLELIGGDKEAYKNGFFDGGYIDDIDKFDYEYFGLSIQEAIHTDPQQRLILQEVVHALENANMTRRDLQGHKVGVFVGASNFDYLRNIIGDKADMNAIVGNSPAMLSNRVSYIFNFTGPSMTIDTACSSSLVAVQEAVKSLRNQECDLAVVAGVNIILDFTINEGLSKANMLSGEGRCFTFDKKADGYVRSEGIGVIILQKEQEALNESHRIYANILGGAVNQDGRSASLTAPNKNMQVEVIRQAWSKIKIDKKDIEYVEAHGTGTELGDSIEIAALDEAYECSKRQEDSKLKVGAVKTNLGHLESAAGMAGLIKLALSIYNNTLYPVRDLEEINPKLGLNYRKLEVVEKLENWKGEKRIGAISSFGFGGTNCHMVLGKCLKKEAADNKNSCETKRNLETAGVENDRYYFIPITAASPEGLRNRLCSYADYLERSSVSLEELESKLLYHTDLLPYRLCYVVASLEELQEKVSQALDAELPIEKTKDHTIALLFSGQGTQWKGMAQGLFGFSKFQETFQRCRQLFLEMEHCDIQEVFEGQAYQRTLYVQPLLFSIQVSLFELLKEFGIRNKIVYGHSLGEVSAAYAAGAVSLKQAVSIIHYRSMIMDQFTGKGKMLSVAAAEEEINAMLQGEYGNLSVAVVNEDKAVVVAGDNEEIRKLKEQLEEKNISNYFLPVDYAFHYPGLEPYMEVLERQLSGLKTLPSRVKFISTVTGDVLKSSELNEYYWAKNMRNKVQFSSASKVALEECGVVVEVGTATALIPYLANIRSNKNKMVALQKRKSDCVRSLYEALAQLFQAGISIKWETIIRDIPAKLELPPYVFSAKVCWNHVEFEKAEKMEIQEDISAENIQRFLVDFMNKNIVSHVKIGKDVMLDEIPLDSLRLFQFRSMIYEKYGVKLELGDLMSHMTLEGFSVHIYERMPKSGEIYKEDTGRILEDTEKLVTDNQKAIALDQWVNGDSSKYNMSFFWKFDQEMDKQLWEEAYRKVMNSHIALCTVYHLENGRIYQKKAADSNALSAVKLADDKEARAYAHREINTPFQLEEGVCRGALIENEEGNIYFLLVIHHIAIDGISMYLLVQQLVQAYTALKNTGKYNIQMDENYTNFQHKFFLEKESDDHKEKEKYWKALLEHSHFAKRFPLPAAEDMTGENEVGELLFQVSRDTMVKMQRAASELRVSNFAILYAIYQLMYYKITGESSFITCTYFSGRKQKEEMETIGYMVQPLYSKVEVEKGSTAANYIKEMFVQLLAAYEKNISVSELNKIAGQQEESELNHVFVYEKAPVDEAQSLYILKEDTDIELYGMKVKALKTCLDTSQYDLVLMFEENRRNILGKFEYQKGAYSKESINTLKDLFINLLNEVVLQINREICQYPLISRMEEEKVQLLLRGTYSDKMEGILFHDYLSKHAEINPGKIAAVYGETSISYDELDCRSNQLARYILHKTKGEQAAIGICMEKSIDFLIAVFGVMKSGCFYIPLDYHYPVQRLEYIIGDSCLQYIICDDFGREILPDLKNVETIDLLQSAKEERRKVDISISLDDIAYAIYTSGSTGKPKGVLVSHRGIENVVQEQQKLFQVKTEDKICFFASISFDASVFEILMGIGHGAALYFDKREKMGAGKMLHHFLKDHGLTIVTLPASVLESMENKNLKKLRVIITAGEPCSRSVKDKWSEDHRFFNAYGVTEATIWNTTEECVYGDNINIGKSVSNTQLSVVNEELHTCPAGVAGELLISGIGLSKGYIGLEKLNREKFRENSRGEIFYHTGDLVRLGYDHKIEYLGRLDNQVKLRGFRIELEEIGEMLQSHESVSTAIVEIERSSKLEQLIAFVKLNGTDFDEGTEERLKDYIAAYLPHYMVPNQIIPVQEWKLTVNGKIDRKAMMEELSKNRQTSGSAERPEDSRLFETPQLLANNSNDDKIPDSVERELCTYISGITGTTVTVKDNLIRLGMNSIMIFEMISFIHDTFHSDISFEQVMKSSTVEGIAALIKKDSGKELQKEAQGAEKKEMPISDKQRGIWLESNINTENTEYNIPVVLNIHGRVNTDILCESIESLVKEHNILRTRYEYKGDNIAGRIADQMEGYVETVNISHLEKPEKDEEIRSLISQMQNMIFDISDVPLFKFLIVTYAEDEYYLMLTIHHLIADGWSVNLILEQLNKKYRALELGEEFVCELPYQYEDYAKTVFYKKKEKKKENELHRNYWTQKLSEVPAVELAAISCRTERGIHQGENIELTLSSDLIGNINQFSREHQVSVFALMLAAYALTLRNYSGVDALTIGIPNLGRETREERMLIGMFLDILVTKISIHPEQTIASYVKEVMQEVLETYSHKVPYEDLSHWIVSGRQTDSQSVFRVMFNMINFQMDTTSFAGMPMEIIQNQDLNAKYDMTLYVMHQAEYITVRLNYQSRLYSGPVMRQFLKGYEEQLRLMTENPRESLTYCYLGEEDKTVMTSGMEIREDFQGFMNTIWKRAVKNASRQAVIFDGESLSYRDFTKRVEEVQELFREAEIQQGDCLGIVTARTPELIPVVYQALRNETAFLLIDSMQPLARIMDVVKSAGVNVLVNIQKSKPDWRRLKPAGKKDVPSDYRLVTSGTTGKPKCVIGRNEALSHFVKWEAEQFHLTKEDRFSNLSGISHDPIMRDILVPLYLQATVIIPEKSKLTDNNLFEYFLENRITVSHLTPTMAEIVLLNAGTGDRKLEEVKVLFLGGEPLTKDLTLRLLELCPNGEIVNYYGASETPQAMLYSVFNMQNIHDYGSRLPLGKGIADVEGFVMNPDFSLCKAYNHGEILLKTPYLSKGYFCDSQGTKSKFIENPYKKGELLYRTGDYGYKDENENIYFLSRKDKEIKILGHRMDLQEIQCIINQYKKVLSNCTLVYQGDLYSFLVAEDDFRMDDFKVWLKKRCPDYMLPKKILQRENIPTTANGKIDTRQLSQDLEKYLTEKQKISEEENFTQMQRAIKEMWSKILGTGNINLADKFFEIGGDSFKAVQLQYELKQYLNREVDIVDIFNYPTIKSFTEYLGSKKISDSDGTGNVTRESKELEEIPNLAGEKPAGDVLLKNRVENRASKMKLAMERRNRRREYDG